MLALSLLLVPLLGIYLILRSRNRKNHCDVLHSGAVEKSWLRVEITICFTMAIAFLGFGILILYSFFKLMDNVYFLLAGLSSILISLLYMINGLITVGLLQQGVTDIMVDENVPRQLSYTTTDDPNHFSISVMSKDCDKTIESNRELKGQPRTSIKDTSAAPMKKHQHAVSFPVIQQNSINIANETYCYILRALFAGQRSEMDQHIIEYIREELDRHLDDKAHKHDNSATNYCIDHCANGHIDDVLTIDSREQCQCASTINSTIAKSAPQTIWNQVSRRKATPIPLFVPAEVRDMGDNYLIQHFNDHFSTPQQHGPLFVHKISSSAKADSSGHVACPVELFHPQQLRMFNKTAAKCDEKDHSKGDDSFKHTDCERFSDDDSTSESLVGSIYCYSNSMPVELKSVDLAVQPQLLAVEVPAQNIRAYSRNTSDNSSSQQMSVIASRIHSRRENSRGSQRRCYLKHDNHRGSGNTQHPSCVALTNSTNKGSQSFTSYRSAIRGRQKISNLSREQESMYPFCMPSIVTAIDSGRESDIIRKNFPRRTSSRDKKTRNRGFDVAIRAQSDSERFEDRRVTLDTSSLSYNKPIEAYLVTEF
ncbi:unnamed protein product [Litomosoides sigmodontis]|uniref:Uncharacterized protein n=1 Tax=Litomosoides sigmodontis TaxID=42156 RepID=A0A3P6SIM0_LITSI|nr:unnamed protein product [Litomosoides sigmodontis]